ncbi:NASP-related protein sim3 [Termitomyces sp. J132]|nr:NASP-related protein sim3 [Termitomyces sp. J132]
MSSLSIAAQRAAFSADNVPTTDATSTEVTIETAIEHAKRAFALKKFEQAIEHYATALELMTKKVGEDSPETADLYFLYGKALLENAISQSSVLGKEQDGDGHEEEAAPADLNGKGPILSFSGDAEEVDDPVVDLFAQAEKTIAEAEKIENDEDEDGEDAEPEDDFNASWEVLDLARAIYDKVKDQEDDDEIRLKLADTYIALGDVSLETEKFDQAITDYEAGLDLKIQLLPISSRQIAEAHYKLSMVLDLTPGRLSDAIVQAEKALESVESRLAELRDGLSGQLSPLAEEEKPSAKGKGKSTGSRLVRDELVQNMSKSRIEAEIKEFSELREDLALKVEELKTTPNNSSDKTISAPAMAAQALDKELNTGSSAACGTACAVVNDLTSIVKKKKPAEKRKADVDAESSGTEKKARLDTPEA